MDKKSAREKICELNKRLLLSEKGDQINIEKKRLCSFKAAVVFPAVYGIAMNTPGFQYIYFASNDNPHFFAQRAYFPDKKILGYHKRFRIPLLTQECNTPLNQMDMVMFSINYEGNYLNILEMLKLSKIPLLRKDRDSSHPIIIGGGICPTYNPMPLSRFFDAFVIGEAESVLQKILDSYAEARKSKNFSKIEYLKRISRIQGVFVPSLPNKSVKKAKTCSIDYEPRSIISRYTKYPNHLFLEISRGCSHGCHFCILGKAFLKSRIRKKEIILDHARKMSKLTNRIRLICASDTDHPDIIQIYSSLRKMGFKITIGSQRADQILKKRRMFDLVSNRMITIAPEAGHEELRFRIGKRIKDEDIYRCIRLAAKSAISSLQIFMIIGFFNDDKYEADGVIELIKKARKILDKNSKKNIRIIATINCHIKKPHTIFECAKQMEPADYYKSIRYIKKNLKGIRNLRINVMDKRLLLLETILVRGTDRDGLLIKGLLERSRTSNPEEIKAADISRLVKPRHLMPIAGNLPWKNIDLCTT